MGETGVLPTVPLSLQTAEFNTERVGLHEVGLIVFIDGII